MIERKLDSATSGLNAKQSYALRGSQVQKSVVEKKPASQSLVDKNFAHLFEADARLKARVLTDARSMIEAQSNTTNWDDGMNWDDDFDLPFHIDAKCRVEVNAEGNHVCKAKNIFANCVEVLAKDGSFNGCEKDGLTASGKSKAIAIGTIPLQITALMISLFGVAACCAFMCTRH